MEVSFWDGSYIWACWVPGKYNPVCKKKKHLAISFWRRKKSVLQQRLVQKLSLIFAIKSLAIMNTASQRQQSVLFPFLIECVNCRSTQISTIHFQGQRAKSRWNGFENQKISKPFSVLLKMLWFIRNSQHVQEVLFYKNK